MGLMVHMGAYRIISKSPTAVSGRVSCIPDFSSFWMKLVVSSHP